jgi:hypothetical protein
MRVIIFCAAILAALTAIAKADQREQCAASTGAKKGAAFNACMSAAAKPTADKGDQRLYRDPGSRACRRMGTC